MAAAQTVRANQTPRRPSLAPAQDPAGTNEQSRRVTPARRALLCMSRLWQERSQRRREEIEYCRYGSAKSLHSNVKNHGIIANRRPHALSVYRAGDGWVREPYIGPHVSRTGLAKQSIWSRAAVNGMW